jgi:hypothetical protein
MGEQEGAVREVREVGMGGGSCGMCVCERERKGEGGGVKLIYVGKWEWGGVHAACV